MFKKLMDALRQNFPTKPVAEATRVVLYDYGSTRDALLYAPLFVPELIEVDGSVVITEGDPDTPDQVRTFLATRTGSVEEVEDHFNLVELPSLFGSYDGLEWDELLFEFVAEAWRGRLALKFPGRKFNVWVDPPEIDGYPVLRFHEVRTPRAST